MIHSAESLITDMVWFASRGDMSEVANRARLLQSKIDLLRDRIDELGGYHDDI